MKNDTLEKTLDDITNKIRVAYQTEIECFLKNSEELNLTEADVIVLIMNILCSTSLFMFYSIFHYMGDKGKSIDHSYLIAKVINALKDDFIKAVAKFKN